MLIKIMNPIQKILIILLFFNVFGCSQSKVPSILVQDYYFLNLDGGRSKLRQSNDTLYYHYCLDGVSHETCYKILATKIVEKYIILKLKYHDSIPENAFCPGNYSMKAIKIISSKQLKYYDPFFECLSKYQLDTIKIDTLIFKNKPYLTYLSDSFIKELSVLKRISSIDDIKKVINAIEGNDFNSGKIMYSAEQLNKACIQKGYNPVRASLIIDSIMMTQRKNDASQ
jgi:hypothetical protein